MQALHAKTRRPHRSANVRNSVRAPESQKLGSLTRIKTDATSRARLAGRTQDWTLLRTSKGVIVRKIGRLRLDPAPLAWLRLQELHSRAAGRHDSWKLPEITKLSVQQAKHEYHRAIGAALGQMLAVPPFARLNIFRSLINHVIVTGSVRGLESLFLLGLIETTRRGDLAFTRQAWQLWEGYRPTIGSAARSVKGSRSAAFQSSTGISGALVVDPDTLVANILSDSNLSSIASVESLTSLIDSGNAGAPNSPPGENSQANSIDSAGWQNSMIVILALAGGIIGGLIGYFGGDPVVIIFGNYRMMPIFSAIEYAALGAAIGGILGAAAFTAPSKTGSGSGGSGSGGSGSGGSGSGGGPDTSGSGPVGGSGSGGSGSGGSGSGGSGSGGSGSGGSGSGGSGSGGSGSGGSGSGGSGSGGSGSGSSDSSNPCGSGTVIGQGNGILVCSVPDDQQLTPPTSGGGDFPSDDSGTLHGPGAPVSFPSEDGSSPVTPRSFGALSVLTPTSIEGAGLASLIVPTNQNNSFLLTAMPKLEVGATNRIIATLGYLAADAQLSKAAQVFNTGLAA
jgi:hypothetical protein